MTMPKEKAMEYFLLEIEKEFETNKFTDKFTLFQICKAIDIALEEQAKEIFKDLQEDDWDYYKLKKKYGVEE